jgi:hypothetical protein
MVRDVNIRNSIIGPPLSRWQAVLGSAIAFGLALLIGFALNQGSMSAIFTASVVGLAVLISGLVRVRSTQRAARNSL